MSNPVCIIFIDGIEETEHKKLVAFLESNKSKKMIPNLTFTILANSNIANTLSNPQILEAMLISSVKRQQKIEKGKKK